MGHKNTWATEVHGIRYRSLGEYRSSSDTEAHGIQKFIRYRSSWVTEVHEIEKFIGYRSTGEYRSSWMGYRSLGECKVHVIQEFI
jgi:hypothetical protein